MSTPHLISRRAALRSLVGGSLLLPGLLSELLAADAPAADPLTPKPPHHAPKAKRVIFLFSTGGVSHVDTFDYKPKLDAADGKTLGAGGGLSNLKRPLLRPAWEFMWSCWRCGSIPWIRCMPRSSPSVFRTRWPS